MISLQDPSNFTEEISAPIAVLKTPTNKNDNGEKHLSVNNVNKMQDGQQKIQPNNQESSLMKEPLTTGVGKQS